MIVTTVIWAARFRYVIPNRVREWPNRFSNPLPSSIMKAFDNFMRNGVQVHLGQGALAASTT